MSINLTVVIDNDEAIKKFKELQKVAKNTTSEIVTDSERMDMAIRKFGTALASLGLGYSLTDLARQVATVRGEFQQLEVAFSTMLGSKAEADALMERVVNLAATTPFDLQGVANGTKQLLAYGSTANEVTDEIRMLGDIAAGMSLPLGDLVYLYGTTRTQGRLFTRDLMQFTGRGIPLMEELAKQFGVSKDQVSKLVTAGKVGFAEVEQALRSMTSEGGKFYNLMEEQSKTITGRMSNLSDSIQQMFNEIGKQSEGAINKAIDGASYLAENYETIGRALTDIIAAYGAYKAAVMLVAVAQRAELAITAQMAVEKGILAASNHAVSDSALRFAATQKMLALSIQSVKTALKGMVSTITNPYVLAGAVIGTLIFATYKWITAKSDEERAIERVNKKMEDYRTILKENSDESKKAASILTDANASMEKRVEAYDEIIKRAPELKAKYEMETLMLMNQRDIEKEIDQLERDRLKRKLRTEIEEMESAPIPQKLQQTGTAGIGIYTIDQNALNERNYAIQEAKKQLAELEEQDKRAAKATKTLDELEKNRDQPKNAELIKEVSKERHKAQQEANKAELELQKSYIDDKAMLLALEKEQELKAIEDRIKATTDAETKGYLERQKKAVEALYDKQMDEAMRAGEETMFSGVAPIFSKADRDNKIQFDAPDVTVALKESAEQNIPIIEALFSDMRNMTSDDLNSIADAAEAMLSSIDDPEKLEAMTNRIEKFRDKADELENPLEKIKNGIKGLFTFKPNSEGWNDAFADLRDGMEGVLEITKGLDEALEAIGAGNALDGAIDGMTAAMDALDAAEKGAQIGGAFGPMGAAIGAAAGAVASLVKSISQIHDKRSEARIQRLQEQIDQLTSSFDKLEKKINESYSTTAAQNLEYYNHLLRRQQELINKQIAEEQDKKKPDSNRVKEWEQELDSIASQIEENTQKAKESLTGISFDSFRDSFLSAITDMDMTSEEFAQNFETMLQKAILDALITQKYQDRIDALYESFSESMKDGQMTDAEIQRLRAEKDAIFDEMMRDREAMADVYGWSGDESSTSSSTNGGFQAMSQETGSELNGRFTDIQGKVTEMRNFVMEQLAMGKMQYAETVNIRDIMIQINGNVADIRLYTQVLPEMRDSINSMNKKLDNL